MSEKSIYKYKRINTIRTNLLKEVNRDLYYHIKKTETKINDMSIKEFETKYQNYVITFDNEYYNGRNNDINCGKRAGKKSSEKNLFNMIKFQSMDLRNEMNNYMNPVTI